MSDDPTTIIVPEPAPAQRESAQSDTGDALVTGLFVTVILMLMLVVFSVATAA